MCVNFDRLINSPGLNWVAEKIFLFLDCQSLANCCLVCSSWYNCIVHCRVWRKKLDRHLAPKGSFYRYMIETRRQFVFEDLKQHPYESQRCSHLCWKILRAHKPWLDPSCQLYMSHFFNQGIVRNITTLNGEKLVFILDNALHISSRMVHSSSPIVDRIIVDGHRREVSCLATVDNFLIVSGSRDRCLKFWHGTSGLLLSAFKDAHRRLITCVKLRRLDHNNVYEVFSTSRDRTVKIWHLAANNWRVSLSQTLEGHEHSVWGVAFSNFNNHLITASADKTLGVWAKQEDVWTRKGFFDNAGQPVRHVVVLQMCPFLALSGDLVGYLRVWNMETMKLQYQVPDVSLDKNWFCSSGAVMAMDQTEYFCAAAFADCCVALYSTHECEVAMKPNRVIDVASYLSQGFVSIRGICVNEHHIYVCTLSRQEGIIMFQHDDG